jgi:hypothetical protein
MCAITVFAVDVCPSSIGQFVRARLFTQSKKFRQCGGVLVVPFTTFASSVAFFDGL